MTVTPIEAAGYEILVDKKIRPEPIMGLKVNPVCGESLSFP